MLISLSGHVEAVGIGLPRLKEIQLTVPSFISANSHVIVSLIISLHLKREHRRSLPWKTSGIYAAGKHHKCQSSVVIYICIIYQCCCTDGCPLGIYGCPVNQKSTNSSTDMGQETIHGHL